MAKGLWSRYNKRRRDKLNPAIKMARARYTKNYKKSHHKEINEYNKNYKQEMRDIAKEIGNCSKCFLEKDDPRFKLCSKCRDYYRNYYKGGQRKCLKK